MSDSTKWIDWHPKPGDVFPFDYRFRRHHPTVKDWRQGQSAGFDVSQWHVENFNYQIPAPEPKEIAMKYWQPRREPLAKGWTLADVPLGLRCDVVLPGGKKAVASADLTRTVWSGGVDAECLPSECRVIRVLDPIPPGAMTLDQVPEGVRCVHGPIDGIQYVAHRVGTRVYPGWKTHQSDGNDPKRCQVLHILDQLPQVADTLDTLPVGRVVEQDGSYWFKSENRGWFHWFGNIGVMRCNEPPNDGPFTVTDYLMELKEVV